MHPDMNLIFPTNENWWRWALWLTLVAPLLEEFVLRAGLHQALLRSVAAGARDTRPDAARAAFGRPPIRIAGLSCVFCLMHLARGAGLALAVVPAALLLGWVYERTGDWQLCAVAHGGLNLLWLAACIAGFQWLPIAGIAS